jgi:hypothetical protein
MLIRQVVALRGALSSGEALHAVLPPPWKVIYVQPALSAAVCEASAPDYAAGEALKDVLKKAIRNALAVARAA